MLHKKEYIWAMIGRFLPQFIYLITTMILARFISPDDFGKIGVLAIFFTVANTLIDSGLGGSLVKEKVITDIDCSTISVFNLFLSHLLYLIIFLFSGLIERHYNVEGLGLIVKISCVIFIINAWGLVPQSLLVRDLRFRTSMIIGIVSVLVSAFTAIIMAVMGCGVWALVAYQLVGGIVTVLSSVIVTKYKVSFLFSWQSFKRLLSFGVFTTLSSTIDTIYENLTVNLFGKYLSIQKAGLLYQAKRIEEVPTQTLTITISSVAFPVLTKMRMEAGRFVEECASIFKMVLLLMLPLLACLSLFASPILLLLFGNKWVDAAPYLSLLVFAGVFKIAENLNRSFIKSTTKVDKLFIYTIIKRSIGIGILIVFLMWRAESVLIGYIISTFIGFIANCILLARISEFTFIKQLYLFLIVSVPTLLFYALMVFVQHTIAPLYLQIVVAVVLIMVYYLFVLRLYGINLFTTITSLMSSKKDN